jgi:putative Holliday junction resolvase
MRTLAVDPGEKHHGLALSDPTNTIANPLAVVHHVSRLVDAATIAQMASEHQADTIVVGQSVDEDGRPTLAGRRAARLAAAIRAQTNLPVVLWDEFLTTQSARQAAIDLNISRRQRRGHLDSIAATVILQSYLDVHQPN